ncbi:MAG: transglycosylase SLT domain-containing protein [Flavobacteriales bacterium]|nr:transglycosylase SLT domain-containing protein [Flavobacteriales bacterium]
MKLKIKHISLLILSFVVQASLYALPKGTIEEIPDSILTIYDMELIIPPGMRPAASDATAEGEVIIIEDDSEMLRDVFSWETYESISLMDSIEVNDSHITSIHDSIIRRRIEHLDAHSPMILEFNPEVRRYINMYLGQRRSSVARMVGLSLYYYRFIDQILESYGIPLELKHLVVIESAFNPRARSRVGASGLWQFMLTSGRMYGLRTDSYVDERYDPVKSTHSAAKLLKALYDMFGDWNLALAAYNYGSGNVRKAIARSGGERNFWKVRAYMPRETRNYVTAFIAANYVMNYYRHHGIVPEVPAVAHMSTDTVAVKNLVSFDMLAEKLDMPKEELQFLNPQFKLGAIPFSSEKQYSITLPTEKAVTFASLEEGLYAEAREKEAALKKSLTYRIGAEEGPNGSIVYRVKSGDTLSRLAVRYGVSVRNIQRWNNMKSTKLKIGQRLTIYPRR